MVFAWVAGACIILAASFVMGLAGFGIGLVGLAFLPFVMSPATAVVLLTLYAFVIAIAIFVPLRRDFRPHGMLDLVVGTVVGTPFGVWVLATFPASALNRLIGLVLVAVVLLEWRGLYPEKLSRRRWGLGAGLLAGLIGGAVGTPGPPVILYATAQGWSPRTMKANLQAFFAVNQGVILVGYWWASLLTAEVWRLTAAFAVPAAIGLAVGVSLFNRIDQAQFRRMVFGLLGISGLVLIAHG